jgi:hypothetical protein
VTDLGDLALVVDRSTLDLADGSVIPARVARVIVHGDGRGGLGRSHRSVGGR